MAVTKLVIVNGTLDDAVKKLTTECAFDSRIEIVKDEKSGEKYIYLAFVDVGETSDTEKPLTIILDQIPLSTAEGMVISFSEYMETLFYFADGYLNGEMEAVKFEEKNALVFDGCDPGAFHQNPDELS